MDRIRLLKMMKKHEETVEKTIQRFFMSFVTFLLLISNIPVNNLSALENKTLTYENEEYTVVLTYDEDSKIPDGSVLKVEQIDTETEDYSEYAAKTKGLLKWENEDFKLCSYLQISILDKEGKTVIPQNKVSVKLVLAEEKEDEEKELVIESSNVIAFNDENTLINGVTADTIVNDDDDISFEFSSDSKTETSFPVVALAQTVKEKVIKASDDNSYVVQASYDADSGIPLDAEMIVSEIREDDSDYDTYVEKSVDKLCDTNDNVLLAKAFDISFIDPETGEEYQPSGDVSISIKLLNEDFGQYDNLDIVHIHGDENDQVDVIESDIEDDTVKFVTDGLSVFVVFAYTVSSETKEYAFKLEGDTSTILLSNLLTELNISDFNTSDVSTVTSDLDLIVIEKIQDSDDWQLSFSETFNAVGTLTLTLSNNQVVKISVSYADKLTPEVTAPEALNPVYNGEAQALVSAGSTSGGMLVYSLSEDGDYSANIPVAILPDEYTIYYKVIGDEDYYDVAVKSVTSTISKRPVTVTANDNSKQFNGDEPELSAEVAGLIGSDTIVYSLSRREGENVGTYTITPSGDEEQGNYLVSYIPGTFTITAIPVTLTAKSGWRNYDGSEKTLSGFTSSVEGLTFPNTVRAEGSGTAIGSYEVTFSGVILGTTTDSTGNYVVSETADGVLQIDEFLSKEMIDIDGSWATWQIDVNSKLLKLNDGNPLTLNDTFTSNQSIDYSSIQVTSGVTYDYRGSTGTFVIPDETKVTISYRTRIAANAGEVADFGNTALLKDSDGEIDHITTDESHVIYPSASDVAGNTGKYMVKLYVYGDANMQTGISGAQFILLDANKRPLSFKKGDNTGEGVTFTTNENGWVNIELNEEEGDVAIEKNTAYYLEMIKTPEGYKRDSTLYNFMITDDPSYNSGGVWTYYNGDTIKVRLYAEEASLNVSIRFSGNYSLRTDQQNNIIAVLQKRNNSTGAWEELERHPYSDFVNGSLTFSYGTEDNPFEVGQRYRVIEENQIPWDIGEGVIASATYYLIVGSGDSENDDKPMEFTVTNENLGSSFNIVIDNEYEEPKLTITKMNKSTGETLSGAVFTVKKAKNDQSVASYTTGDDGLVVISSSASYFESEVLYYVEETTAPEHYLLPSNPLKTYFYFCNDAELIPSILADLPEGETAVNLTETYESLSLDNQKETITIPVMKTWQGNRWPGNVQEVVVGLYMSVNGADPVPVLDSENEPLTISLTSYAPYNNKAFTDLPTRDDQNNQITYSIKEEHVYIAGDTDIISDYTQEYGVSDAGVYIVRNKQATSLTVEKYWYDYDGDLVTDESVLAQQSTVTFDVYRSTEMIPEGIREGNVTREEMETFVSSLRKVRSNLSFGKEQNWTMTINDLDKKDNYENPYYYYVFENIPSFGDETYVPDEDNKQISIKNSIAPETVQLTVSKEVKDDERHESHITPFPFTLLLEKGDNPIRSYTVGESLTTDWNGEVDFGVKDLDSIVLTVPVGVTVTITENFNPEYEVTTESQTTDIDTESGRVFKYDTTAQTNVSVNFVNTLKVICKVEFENNEGVLQTKLFESLKSALQFIRNFSENFHGEATIQMLVDYNMPSTDSFVVEEGEKITLTTAATSGTDFPFVTDRTDNTDTAIITRYNSGGSLFTNNGNLILENVWLDGAKDSCTANANGGLIYNTGSLSLNQNVYLQNSKSSGKGGAIYSTGVVNMVSNTEINSNTAASGSAIYLAGGTLNMSGGSIRNNISTNDGAVTVEDTACVINLYGSPVIFDNTNASGSAANIYLGADSDNIINVISPGLQADALIGVWGMESHREIGEQFASSEYEITANLNRFVNDLYDYRGKLKEGTSTNIVWDGLYLKIKKVADSAGANPNDTFTITLTSASIRKSTYTIDGSVNYVVTPSRSNKPGSIVFYNVKANDEITITPLPVGTYTISEADSNYDPDYTAINKDISQQVDVSEEGVFALDGNTELTATNTRRLSAVTLSKSLVDRLLGSEESKEFSFDLKLTDTDGTAVSGFELKEGLVTDSDGVASVNISPINYDSSGFDFVAPVGAKLEITEVDDENYRITASAVTKQGSETIDDLDTEHDNIFSFIVADDGANINFDNVRKLAEIVLCKELENKVSNIEPFEFTITLTREDGNPASNYVLNDDDPDNPIVTDNNGQVKITFDFEQGESSRETKLYLPEGTKLKVEETVVKKTIDDTDKSIYDTTYSLNGGSPVRGSNVTVSEVKDTDSSIVFKNVRKTQTITVKNTVSGYSGNVVPFAFTATIDGGDNDYNVHDFVNGVQTFELTTGQSKTLTVPYGSTLKVAEQFVIGYDTTVKRGSAAAQTKLYEEFVVSKNETLNFTNSQLIGLVIENKTSSVLNSVVITVSYGNKIYRVNDDMTGQELVSSNKTATINIDADKSAILEISHKTGSTDVQDYTVKGSGLSEGYYYTINNEPSFHEYADPAILRIYGEEEFEVKGKLRYSVNDSTVTFTEQPLVSFDANGGVWTAEMEGYHDRNGNQKVYQIAVNEGEKVSKPSPDPIYSSEGIEFLGWTVDHEYAIADHSTGEIDSSELYNFDTEVKAPFTLYAIWKKGDTRTVTVKNSLSTDISVKATLTRDGNPVVGHELVQGYETDENGQVTIPVISMGSINLNLPISGRKLVLESSNSNCIAYSSTYSDNDDVNSSFTINPVDSDGTVAFIAGICKITDSSGTILYRSDGSPAVYSTLADAFSDYNGTLYTDASHTTTAAQAAVKMLIDEYAISSKHTFPTKDVILTTAGKNDADYPYAGVREYSTLFRSTSFVNDSLFAYSDTATSVTLTKIILDGKNVELNNTANGGLINQNKDGSTLNIETGTTLRNVKYSDYSNGNNSSGGAIYIQKGTLNVDAGLFANLHAYQGGAICATGGTLNVKGTNGSTQFEDCYSEKQDGGAIYYNNKNNALIIDGGSDKDNPGIVFTRCEARYTNGTNDAGDGGAIFVSTDYSQSFTLSGCKFIECSSKTNNSASTNGYGGGAVNAWKVKSLSVSDCTFVSCDTLCGGGAIAAYVKTDDAGITISNCSFDNCSCKSQGGALAVYQKDNGAINSATKLSIYDSSFNDCSSGTNNSSGGAIQCYLPCMDFNKTTFADCWAGKEGGAVNHFFGGNYVQVWNNSTVDITDCSFYRCRAEDRYDTGAVQHYGGGLNTKAKVVHVNGSYFEDCVSTLKEGGALHLGGQGNGSLTEINDSTFKNCSAKNGGGALLASAETLKIDNSKFYGCSSSASNGGAVYHYRNSRGDSTQNLTEIKNSTFSNDPGSESENNPGCSAALNGGAIWTRAKTVTIEDCTIDKCSATGNGGAIYLSKNSSLNAVISGSSSKGSITNCEATNGSAVYTEYNVKLSGMSITDNTCFDINDGAVHGVTLYFEGKVIVKDNKCSEDSVYKHDVLMQNDNATTIYTTINGLEESSMIGVYVPDQHFNNRGTEGKAFGTWVTGGDNYLDCFFNDRDDGLFGYQSSVNDHNIYWGVYLCKITDANGNTLTRTNGRDAIYQRLSMALDDFTSVTGGKPVYIKMLIENYNIQQVEQINNFPNADITLTTETYKGTEPVEGKYDGKHPYRGTEGTVCTISRVNSDNQLFKLENTDAVFQLENISLDGRKDKTSEKGDLRLIEASAGSLFINGGTTFKYGYSSTNGGAINISSETVKFEIHSSEDGDVLFDHCTSKNDNTNAKGGGAVYSLSTVTIDNENRGKISFTDCNARRGGAIMIDKVSENVNLSVTGVEFINCYSLNEGGAVYVNNNNNTSASTTITKSLFENCYSYGNDQWSYGGAVDSKNAYLTIHSCHFRDCYALSNGGAVNHGSNETNRLKTIITDSVFENCKTVGTNGGYSYGGSISTWAKDIEITDCEIKNSSATNNGGALYCQSDTDDSNVVISGTSFDNCTSSNDDGYGGAVYSKAHSITLKNSDDKETAIRNCSVISENGKGYSGALYSATDNSIIIIKGDTLISGCYADKGATIYLKKTVTLELSESPEFTKNGYTTGNLNATEGACIYLAEGSLIDLSGSPKFSRNNITNVPRVTNGGTTDYVRQDLYLAGYNDVIATSIHISGELTGDTIWIWPEQSPHRLPEEQFATTETGVSAESLEKLRNALDDQNTTCSHGEYLAGVRLVNKDSTGTLVYWDKMYSISFKKIDNKAVAVANAWFTLYTGKDCSEEEQYKSAKSADGENDTDPSGEILPRGVVEYSSIPIGVYYMKETAVPDGYKANDVTYIVLVGTPSLEPTQYNQDLWKNGGPLDVENAATLVAKHTVNSGKYYGIFALKADGKADLSRNLASANTGIVNTRNDYEVYFMKTDSEGLPLPYAEFSIYSLVGYYDNNYPKLEPWSREGEDIHSAKSADGTSQYKKIDGEILPKGVVYFREIPVGTYYLLETAYPDRNGNNRRTFYVETDRVLKLEVRNNVDDFVLSEWQEDGTYIELNKNDEGYYVVSNIEAYVKLTDNSDKLLYKLGHDGETLLPAIYPSLQEGFDAAQNGVLVDADHNPVANESLNPALKLKMLKDFVIDSNITYNSERNLTLTTAERTASSTDRYIFSTTRTSDTSRAEISRGYSEDTSENANNGALITVLGNSNLTLQNVNFNGHSSDYNGRAVHVTDGSLNILNSTRFNGFKQEAAVDSTDGNNVRGGAILMDDNTTLTIDGGASNRSAVFTNNQVINNRTSGSVAADGGAISIGDGCTVSISNAQFTSNSVSSGDESAALGGAIKLGNTTLDMMDVVIRQNTAYEGSAVYVVDDAVININGGSINGNITKGTSGGAINVGGIGSRIYFSGSPYVYANYDTAQKQQKNVVLNYDTNEIIRTSSSGLTGGTIGVYVIDGTDGSLFEEHGRAGKPFGTFASSNNLKAFKNDRLSDLYGVRNEKDNSDIMIYWVNLGVSVAFKKIDSFGNMLDGASFTLYTDRNCTNVYQKDNHEYAITVSANGTTTRNSNNVLLEKGTVLFEEIHEGIYYMKENKSANSSGSPEGYLENGKTYLVLVGKETVKPSSLSSLLENISQADIDAQIKKYNDDKAFYKFIEENRYAIFLIDENSYSSTYGKAVSVPDIAKYGVLNEPEDKQKTILEKTDDSNPKAPLSGAVFEVLRYDRSKVYSADIFDIITSSFTSGSSGVYFVDDLPYGTYYLHETGYPEGVEQNGSEGWWYTLTVNEDGVSCSTQSGREPS